MNFAFGPEDILVWADWLQDQGVDTADLRAWIESGSCCFHGFGSGSGSGYGSGFGFGYGSGYGSGYGYVYGSGYGYNY